MVFNRNNISITYTNIILISVGLSLYTIQGRIAASILSDGRSLYLGSWDFYALLWLGFLCFLLVPLVVAFVLWIISNFGNLVWQLALAVIAGYCVVRQIDYFYLREALLDNVGIRASAVIGLLGICCGLFYRFHNILIEFLKVSAPLSLLLFLVFGFQTVPHDQIWKSAPNGSNSQERKESTPSVLLVTFERMIYSHVFDQDGSVDSRMFPNIAWLADTSDVYHQAYAGSNSTPLALSSIYSGLDAYRFTHDTDQKRIRLTSTIPSITSIFEDQVRFISITSDIYTEYCNFERHRCINALGKNNNSRRLWLIGTWMYEQLKIFVPVWLFKEVFMVAEPEREITWDMLAKPDFIGIDTSEDALHIDEQVGIREMELFLQEIDALSDQSTLYIMHNMLNHSVDLKSSTLLGRTEAERLNDLARGRESIARLDDQLGKLIKKLKDKGIFDSSILVIHTDTGNEVANSILAKGPARIENTDELARVVLLVKRPNQQSRRDLEQLVGQRDILPIILHHAKIDASNVQFDGRAIVDPDDTGSVEDRALRYTNFGFVYELENPATHWSRIN